jgi:hypothetical protein
MIDGLAAAFTLLNRGTVAPRLCLKYVWQAYAAHGAATDLEAGTAYAAWKLSAGKHRGDRNPPAGVPVWWGPRAGSAAGDVVISLGGGRVVATDWPSLGRVGVTTIAARERQIGRPYLGWSESIFDVPVWAPSPAAVPQQEVEEDDMSPIRVHHQVFTNGNQAYVVENDTWFFIPDGAHLAALVKAYGIKLDQLPELNEHDWHAVEVAKTKANDARRSLLAPVPQQA